MKRKNMCISVLALGIFLVTSLPFAEAAAGDYEIAGGVGMSFSAFRSTQGILLGAWITRLGNAHKLRIEPNMEFIGSKSGKSMFLGGVSSVVRLGTDGRSLNPFLDLGVGVSIGSRKTFINRDFGGYFFFSPTAGMGIKFGRLASGVSLFTRWVHHSNANLFPPNMGMDSLYVLLGYSF